jgi:hypothetical protein
MAKKKPKKPGKNANSKNKPKRKANKQKTVNRKHRRSLSAPKNKGSKRTKTGRTFRKVSKVRRMVAKRSAIKGRKTTKIIRKRTAKIKASKQPKKPVTLKKVVESKKTDTLTTVFNSRSLQTKVNELLTWDGNELKPYLLPEVKKIFFRLKIRVPKEYREKFPEGYKYMTVPTPPGMEFTPEKINLILRGLLTEYNNEMIDLISELEYDDPIKVWEVVSIGIQFSY